MISTNFQREFSKYIKHPKYIYLKNDKFTSIFLNNKINISRIKIFHFIRDPINTIISGFNYHLKCNEDWVHIIPITKSIPLTPRCISNGLNNLSKINNINDMILYETKYRMKNMSKCYTLSNELNMINIKNITYDLNYALKNGLNIMKWYNLNQINGLFWEFVRYFNCEYPEFYLMIKLFDRYLRNNYYEFKMKSFFSSDTFDNNVNKMIEASQSECDIFRKNEKKHNQLFAALKKFDSNKYDKNNEHITRNSHNSTSQIMKLLSLDESVCLIIKQMTSETGFEWKYSNFC